MTICLTFRESLRVGNIIFETGESLTVLYLGGGDTLRFEVPSSVVRQELMR